MNPLLVMMLACVLDLGDPQPEPVCKQVKVYEAARMAFACAEEDTCAMSWTPAAGKSPGFLGFTIRTKVDTL